MKWAYVIDQREGGHRRFVWGGVLTAAIFAVMLLIYYGYNFYYPAQLGPEQPIPFSHRLHAGVKGISCLVCHETVASQAGAGLPPLETCLLCHSRLITHLPPIALLREKFFSRQPVVWQRVKYVDSFNYMPDFVYFNHAVHIRRSIDCGHCHGPVKEMDRLVRVQNLNMGFCITCHKYYNASHDCYTCHR